MNVYQLVPTSCGDDDDDDDAGSSEFWSADTAEDGRASRSGFYVDPPVMGDCVSDEMGWYSIVTRDEHDDQPDIVPPVMGDSASDGMGWYSIVTRDDHDDQPEIAPGLLPLDDRRHLTFYDDNDSDSSADNETHFGRILDTISEEEDDDDDVKVAETVTQQRQHLMSEDHRQISGDDLSCQSPKSDVLRSFPIVMNANPHKVFNHRSSSKHEVIAISGRNLSRYSPDSITPIDYHSMSNVLSLSEDTTFYLDDHRFSDHLASFRDDAPDNNDERKLKSTMTENLRYILQHFDYNVSGDSGEWHQRPTGVVNTARTAAFPAGDNAGLVDSINTLMQNDDSHNNEQTVLVTASSDFGEQPESSTTYEPLPSERRNQEKAVDDIPFSQSVITNGQSVLEHRESLERSPCDVSICEDCEDKARLSEFEVNKNIDQENCVEERKRKTDSHMDAYGESKNLYDLSLDKLSDHTDKMDEDNEDSFSLYGNVETDENVHVAVQLSGCRHRVCCGVDQSDIFDSSTSIYDRLDKYNGVANRRKHINCTKELCRPCLPSYFIAKQPSNDSVQLELSMDSEQYSCSLQDDSRSCLVSTNSAASHPRSCRSDELPGVTARLRSDAGSFPLCESSDKSQRFQTFNTLIRENCVTENKDNGAEPDSIVGCNLNSAQKDEGTTAVLVTVSSMENNDLKDNVSNPAPVTTTGDSSTTVSVDSAISMAVNGEIEISSFSHDVGRQVYLAPNCASNYSASNASQDCFLGLTDASGQEKARRSGDRTTQLAVGNSSNDNVPNTQALSSSRMIDNSDQIQRHSSSSSARNPSFVMVDIDIGESRPPLLSTVSDEHRHRLETMKKQLLNAKPVAPTTSPVDSVWNSEIAGKLTPAARSRSSVWTPYDAIFFEETTTRSSATDNRMWRTKSLQTLPGKFTSVGIDVGSKDEDNYIRKDSLEAGLSFDKSRSLSDLRRMRDNEPKLQVYEIGSIDSGLNNENKTTSPAAAPLRPLPSEEFMRRSLERLSLPDWFRNSSFSLLRKKKVADNKHEPANVPMSSCSPTNVGKPTMADWQPLTNTGSHVTLPQSTMMPSTMATSSSSSKNSTMIIAASAYQFDTTDRLHQRTTRSRKSSHNDVHSSEEIKQTAGVSSSECEGGEHLRKRRATKTAEGEQHRCPHDRRTLAKCAHCGHKVLDTALSPTSCQTEQKDLATAEHAMETTTVLSSEASYAPTLDNDDIVFTYSTPEENRKPGKRRETTACPKSSTQHKEHTLVENKKNALKVTAGSNVTGSRSLCSQVTAAEESVTNKGQDKLSAASSLSEERETFGRSEVPPLRRRRKVKSSTCPHDAAVSTEVSDRYVSGRTSSKSSRSKRYTDSACVSASHSRNRASPDVATAASNTSLALETHDISAVVSDQNFAEEDDRKKETKVRRRRQREQQSINAISQATQGGRNNDWLTAWATERDCFLTQQQSGKSRHSHAVMNVKPSYPADELTRMPDSGERREAWIGANGTEGRRRRRPIPNALTSNCTEAPPSECLQNEQQDQLTSTSSFQRRRRRRPRNDLSSRPDAGQQRHKTDHLSTQKLTPDNEHKSIHSQNEYSLNALPKPLPYSGQQRTIKPFYEDSYFTSPMEVDNRMTFYCQPAAGEWSTSRRHPHRRPRGGVAVTGSDSFPADLSTPEVINTEPQLVQDGTQPKSTSYQSELSATEEKPCLSAAARRCRRANRSQRSGSVDQSRDYTSTFASVSNNKDCSATVSPQLPQVVDGEDLGIHSDRISSSRRTLVSKSFGQSCR